MPESAAHEHGRFSDPHRTASGRHRAYVKHVGHHRVRLQLPGARGRPQHLEQVRRRLAEVEGVERVTVNPDTGSVLVSGPVEVSALQRFALDCELFELEGAAPELKPVLDELAGHFNEIDGKLKEISGGRLDLASTVVLGLGTVAVVQLIRGQIGAPALTLLWYAASLAMMARVARPPAASRTASSAGFMVSRRWRKRA
jgi:hypothetical protein